jgi:hypothetical protein
MIRLRTLLALLLLAAAVTGACSLRNARGAAGNDLDVRIEDLGPMASKAKIKLGPLALDPTGEGFVQLLFAFSGVLSTIKQPFDIIAVDLQTGAISRTPASTLAASVGSNVWTWTWGADGRLYMGTTDPPHLISWDPKTRTARDYGRIPKVSMLYSLASGTDGAIYGGGASPSTVFRFDPSTQQMQDLGVFGLPRSYSLCYSYSIGADGRYIYTASGKVPWYVVAYDRQTGIQKNLLTFSSSDFPSVFQYRDGVYAGVYIAAKDGQPARKEFYRLSAGAATKIDALPPKTTLDPVPTTGRPNIFLDLSATSQTRTVRLWYRLAADQVKLPTPVPPDATPEQFGWKSVEVPVTVYPTGVFRLAQLPDGQLLGSTGDYGDMFTLDPASGSHETLGSPTHMAIYGLLPSGGKLYYCGYPGAPLAVYDPTRPWTVGKDTPIQKAPNPTSTLSNPRRLLDTINVTGATYAYYMARDAQGRIYLGCHAERNRTGGGLAVCDPQTGQTTGVGAPTLTNYDVAGLAATRDGSRIVYSSKVVANPQNPRGTPTAAKLFVYDPGAGRIVQSWTPLPGVLNTGILATGAPGQVVGAVSQRGMTTIYAVDVASGQVVYQRQVSGTRAGSFKPGPDGWIWTFLGSTLVRIRPETGEVTPVGQVSGGGGDFTFAGKDLYLAGAASLLRIPGVVAATQ